MKKLVTGLSMMLLMDASVIGMATDNRTDIFPGRLVSLLQSAFV